MSVLSFSSRDFDFYRLTSQPQKQLVMRLTEEYGLLGLEGKQLLLVVSKAAESELEHAMERERERAASAVELAKERAVKALERQALEKDFRTNTHQMECLYQHRMAAITQRFVRVPLYDLVLLPLLLFVKISDASSKPYTECRCR